MTNIRIPVVSLLIILFPLIVQGGERKNELLISWGTGPQPKSDQNNSQIAVDYSFYQFKRSPRSGISLGVGYTRLWTDANTHRHIDAFTFYPQLTLWPVNESLQGAYFFVRALGPTYLSNKRLGQRKQEHFSFQAQAGVGYRMQLHNDKLLLFQLSWKHFSNANLFDDNNGFDIPFTLTLGIDY